MKPIARIALAALAVVALGSGGLVAYRLASAPTPEQRYRLHTVDKGDIVQSVSANGTLNPIVLVNVGTQVSGTVTRLFVDFNDKVEKGQALLELDQSLFAAQARQSEANVINIRTSLDLARATEARMQTLFAQEYVSRQDLDQAVQARQSAEAQYAQAKAAADKDRVNLGYTTIRSPVSGIVVDRVVDLGQTVAASLQTPTLIKIAQDLSEMRIDTSFAEADVGKIREGQKVRFTVDAFPDRSFTGEVQQVRMNATVTQNVVTYNVRISLQNPDHMLLPGMTAYVNIAVARRDDVLVVPNAALRFKPADAADKREDAAGNSNGNGSPSGEESRAKGRKRDQRSGTVYVIDGKTIKPVAVQIGITDNRNTEISGGDLKAGDRVVVGDAPGAAGKPSSVGVRLF
ncbi:efflux RND transporter periplasmic adaptor subunit [uncultured Propionivibrio sp.]|uniref:efflux RND transporter periplasmic adaptor subunit n=1 Tax=uncultured Propionivibrio sp. TaxID=426737 RepID=UPI0029C0589B|nr:efflux RND transporter periplasmic adaptor subunit [uncultured Propionivibrio sp.]